MYKRMHWSVELYDEGEKYGPFRISKGFPITEVEAAVYALREAKRGFSLNVRFVATPVNARMKIGRSI